MIVLILPDGNGNIVVIQSCVFLPFVVAQWYQWNYKENSTVHATDARKCVGNFLSQGVERREKSSLKQLLIQVSFIVLFSACDRKNTMVESFKNAGPGKLFILLN